MDEIETQKIGPCPVGCHYRRCWCTWWIVSDKNKGFMSCPACGVPKFVATPADFVAAKLELIPTEAAPSLGADPIPPRSGREKPKGGLW